MNQIIAKMFSKLGMTKEQIDECFEYCPGLDVVDDMRVKDNLTLLTKYGFPKEDLGALIMENTNFLFSNPFDLEQKLISLGPDVEEKIKDNPYIL
ncbi:MAG: hypothetical protein IKQ31_03675 [Clostridia bacterium]|nr:hypothetical protein [Clostridia bacterium]